MGFVATPASDFAGAVPDRPHERARLARELHDTLAQDFVGLSTLLDAVSMRLAEGRDQCPPVPGSRAQNGAPQPHRGPAFGDGSESRRATGPIAERCIEVRRANLGCRLRVEGVVDAEGEPPSFQTKKSSTC